MMAGNQHSARVNDWLCQLPNELAVEPLLQCFEQTFSAILRRAHQTLGEVTLLAILDCVLHAAAEQYPLVSALEVDGTEVSCRALLARHAQVRREQALLAIRFVLVEFLAVLGNLTAEILTPALHAQLALRHTPRPLGMISEA